MIERLRALKARELATALQKDGFKATTRSGGHRVYRHPDGRRVVLSFHHGSDTFPPKTLKAMIADAGWTDEDLPRLGLMKYGLSADLLVLTERRHDKETTGRSSFRQQLSEITRKVDGAEHYYSTAAALPGRLS